MPTLFAGLTNFILFLFFSYFIFLWKKPTGPLVPRLLVHGPSQVPYAGVLATHKWEEEGRKQINKKKRKNELVPTSWLMDLHPSSIHIQIHGCSMIFPKTMTTRNSKALILLVSNYSRLLYYR
jgi:hypothetical protein